MTDKPDGAEEGSPEIEQDPESPIQRLAAQASSMTTWTNPVQRRIYEDIRKILVQAEQWNALYLRLSAPYEGIRAVLPKVLGEASTIGFHAMATSQEASRQLSPHYPSGMAGMIAINNQAQSKAVQQAIQHAQTALRLPDYGSAMHRLVRESALLSQARLRSTAWSNSPAFSLMGLNRLGQPPIPETTRRMLDRLSNHQPFLRIGRDWTALLERNSNTVDAVLKRFGSLLPDPGVAEIEAAVLAYREDGWLLDALLLSVADDERVEMAKQLNAATRENQSNMVLRLLITVKDAVQANVEIALREMLEPEEADDYIENGLRVMLLALTIPELIERKMHALVAGTALTRTEGMFKRAMHRAGLLKEQQQQVLYGNQEQAKNERDQVLSELHDGYLNTPSFGNGWVVEVSALERFQEVRSMLAPSGKQKKDITLEVESRNHALHDGYLTGSHAYALKRFLYFTGATLMVQAWLRTKKSAPTQP